MNVELVVLDLSPRGVQVALREDASPFWLPRSAPGVEWTPPPEIGGVSWVRVPDWLAAKHRQLQTLRYQRSFAFQAPLAGLDPGKSKERFPMANDMSGALFKNDRKEKPSHPDYRGDVTIEGRKYWLSGWIKERQKGKYLSLAVRLAEERTDDRRQQPAAGRADDASPF